MVWVARGVRRAKPWRTHAALMLLVVAIAFLAWTLARSLTSNASILNPSTGLLEPQYDGRALPIAAAIMTYLISVACLVVTELRPRSLSRT